MVGSLGNGSMDTRWSSQKFSQYMLNSNAPTARLTVGWRLACRGLVGGWHAAPEDAVGAFTLAPCLRRDAEVQQTRLRIPGEVDGAEGGGRPLCLRIEGNQKRSTAACTRSAGPNRGLCVAVVGGAPFRGASAALFVQRPRLVALSWPCSFPDQRLPMPKVMSITRLPIMWSSMVATSIRRR